MNRDPNILIVDDNEEILYILDFFLKEIGIKNINKSTSLYQGIDMAKQCQPCIIMTDAYLIDGLGMEFELYFPAIPIIYVTAYTNIQTKYPIVAKPFTYENIINSLVLCKVFCPCKGEHSGCIVKIATEKYKSFIMENANAQNY